MADSPDDNGDTPMHHGLRGQINIQCLELLLNKGANVNFKNSYGRTPLHEAAKYSNIGREAIDKLITHGALINVLDNEGSSVLHDVLKNPVVSLRMIIVLLKYGADPNCQDGEGLLPLAYVISSTLKEESKSTAMKFLIQASILHEFKHALADQSQSESFGHTISCHFLDLKILPENKRNEMQKFRDFCLEEVVRMCSNKVSLDCPIFDLIYGLSCTTKSIADILKQTNSEIREICLSKYISSQDTNFMLYQILHHILL